MLIMQQNWLGGKINLRFRISSSLPQTKPGIETLPELKNRLKIICKKKINYIFIVKPEHKRQSAKL
jgi:hypothetical protein